MSEEIHSILFDLSATGQADSINKAAQGLQMSNDNLAEAMRSLARRPVALPQQATSAHPAIRALMGAAMMRRGPARYRRPAGIRDRALPPLKPLTADHRVSYTKQAVGSGGRPRGITTQPYSGSPEIRARLRGKRDPAPIPTPTSTPTSIPVGPRVRTGKEWSRGDYGQSRLGPRRPEQGEVIALSALSPGQFKESMRLGRAASAGLDPASQMRLARMHSVSEPIAAEVGRALEIPYEDAKALMIGTRIRTNAPTANILTADMVERAADATVNETRNFLDILRDYSTGE